MTQLSRQFIESASWRIACELMRRHGQRLRLIETHPGGGQYDCLSIYERASDRHVLDLNRVGSAHGWLTDRSMGDLWAQCAAADDPKDLVDAVERLAGLESSGVIPDETPEVVTLRFVAELLAGRLLGRGRWECRNGYHDSSGGGGGPVSDFQRFAVLNARRATRERDDLRSVPEYRFWFVRCDSKPVLALEASTATVWNVGGETFQLFDRFKRERRIGPLVALVARDYLP
jgi:hypothetical protein